MSPWRGRTGLFAVQLSIRQSPDAPLPSPVQSLVNYMQLLKNPRFIARGWLVGTGMMESTRKQWVARRLKGCGMPWSRLGVTLVTGPVN